MPSSQNPTFGDVFEQRLKAIEDGAHACGLTMSDICREAGVSRATPDRWKRDKPNTIKLIESMEKVVDKHKRAAAKRQS